MKRIMKQVMLCLLLASLMWIGTVLADRERLNEELIRLHVVANSDTAEDQSIKIAVRDSVMKNIQSTLRSASDVETAKEYIMRNLPVIQKTAQKTIQALGCEDVVTVSLGREAFDMRKYDSFTLPAGIYEALRIVIGEGKGKNWWCVVFPSLCNYPYSECFSDIEAGAGFPDSLEGALTGKKKYEVRFFLLDVIGKLENRFVLE